MAAVSALFVVLVNAACSNSTVPLEAVEYDVPHKFIGKDGKAARDLSGIACAPGQTVRHCLVIDDEGDSAQWATLDGTSFVAGDPMPLVGESDGDVTFGTRPEVNCPNGDGAFGELDGEAVAFAAPYYYVVGSHGCSRKKGEFRASSFILARLSDEQQGRSKRLSVSRTCCATPAPSAPTLARISMGTTVSTSKVSPSMVTNSSSACVAHPLTAGPSSCGRRSARCSRRVTDPARRPPRRFPIAVPQGTGIRDLTTLADGRLLLLLGPAQEQGLPYSLARIELPSSPDIDVPIKVETLAELPEIAVDGTIGKAEAVVVLNETAAELEVLVLFDGLKNGDPRKFRILLH